MHPRVMLRSNIRKWLFLAVVLVFCFVIARRSALPWFYYIFWMLVVTIVVNWVWLLCMYFFLPSQLQRENVWKVEEDEDLAIKVDIDHNNIVPLFNLVLEDILPHELGSGTVRWTHIDYLAPRSRTCLSYSSTGSLRGRYVLGPLRLYIFDPLCLFYLQKTYDIYSELYVYPQTFPVHGFPPLIKGILPWFGIETSRMSGDEDEFYGVREYKEGDPIRRIHWFSSARKNKLVVKEYQAQSFYRATIIFNLEKAKNIGTGKDTMPEKMIKIAASIAQYLTNRNIAIEVIGHAEELVHIAFNKGPEHLENISKFLAVARPESMLTLGEMFQEFAHQVTQDTTLIVLMADTDWEYFLILLAQLHRSVGVIPIILVSSSFDAQGKPRNVMQESDVFFAPGLKYRPITISRTDNLQEVFTAFKNE